MLKTIFLAVAVVLFIVDGLRTKTLTPIGLAFFAGAFLVGRL